MQKFLINEKTVSQAVKNAEQAVRGPISIKAGKFEEMIRQNPNNHGLPFNKVYQLNIGNPHILGQKPLTQNRDILSILLNNSLIKKPNMFKPDVLSRAKHILDNVPGGLGAQSHSKGVRVAREMIAEKMTSRDRSETDVEDIFITGGASQAVKIAMTALLDEGDSVLGPVPVQPLYTANCDLMKIKQQGYQLDESKNWEIDIDNLKQTVDDTSKGIVIINPGNPTGGVLSQNNIKEILEFAVDRNLVVFADEVQKENIYTDKQFQSFRQVAVQENLPSQLFSFHSCSKGQQGECGLRGGQVHCHNTGEYANQTMLKLVSIDLCCTVVGQVLMGLLCSPPKKGQESFELWHAEKTELLGSLKRKTVLLKQSLDDMTGITSSNIEGAMQAFPSINFSQKFMAHAKEQGKQPDQLQVDYVLDNTGIVLVPGSGFGQKEGTWHFRITCLVDESEFQLVMDLLKNAHEKFMLQWKD